VEAHKSCLNRLTAPNVSLEATWDAPRFASDGAILLIWRAREDETPGASPFGSAPGPRKNIGIGMLREARGREAYQRRTLVATEIPLTLQIDEDGGAEVLIEARFAGRT
jgi:hypothetical protein